MTQNKALVVFYKFIYFSMKFDDFARNSREIKFQF